MKPARNPARSRPLSSNVKRLILLSRSSPENPEIQRNPRHISEQDYAYCDLQGNIFMAAVDLGYDISSFSEIFMNSQVAGVIDHSFSVTNGMENDHFSKLLNVPILLKSPDTIVSLTMWLNQVAARMTEGESPGMAIVQAYNKEAFFDTAVDTVDIEAKDTVENLILAYEYAYWLGYIYRCECQLHSESSRMVYGVLPEEYMRKIYGQMMQSAGDYDMDENAPEICKRIDLLLFNKLRSGEQGQITCRKKTDKKIQEKRYQNQRKRKSQNKDQHKEV